MCGEEDTGCTGLHGHNVLCKQGVTGSSPTSLSSPSSAETPSGGRRSFELGGHLLAVNGAGRSYAVLVPYPRQVRASHRHGLETRICTFRRLKPATSSGFPRQVIFTCRTCGLTSKGREPVTRCFRRRTRHRLHGHPRCRRERPHSSEVRPVTRSPCRRTASTATPYATSTDSPGTLDRPVTAGYPRHPPVRCAGGVERSVEA
jgi:hypothetical protein